MSGDTENWSAGDIWNWSTPEGVAWVATVAGSGRGLGGAREGDSPVEAAAESLRCFAPEMAGPGTQGARGPERGGRRTPVAPLSPSSASAPGDLGTPSRRTISPSNSPPGTANRSEKVSNFRCLKVSSFRCLLTLRPAGGAVAEIRGGMQAVARQPGDDAPEGSGAHGGLHGPVRGGGGAPGGLRPRPEQVLGREGLAVRGGGAGWPDDHRPGRLAGLGPGQLGPGGRLRRSRAGGRPAPSSRGCARSG